MAIAVSDRAKPSSTYYLFHLYVLAGFLYLGSYSHRYLSATQYVAPLMADFDPSLDVGSTISYFGDGEYLVLLSMDDYFKAT